MVARSLLVSLGRDIVECPHGTPAVHFAGCDGYEESGKRRHILLLSSRTSKIHGRSISFNGEISVGWLYIFLS